jgi:membrane associated rhomboid family serine protease
MTLPPFSGVVRRLVIVNVGVFFAIAVLGWLVPGPTEVLVQHLVLRPSLVVAGELWQLATYSVINTGLLSTLWAVLTLWFCGSMLEGAYGGRWVAELYGASVVGAAVLASALSFTRVLGLSPGAIEAGAWSGVFGLLMAIAVRFGDEEFLLYFLVRVKAKYMVTIYLLIALALLLREANSFGALLQLSGALFGYLYVRFAPRRGLGFGVAEQYYGARNAWYRAKRRRAAKKFEVYMGKQGRQVRFDENGRYLDPDDEKRDPKDRRWMN